MAFLWDWFTGVLKGLGLMNKSGNVVILTKNLFFKLLFTLVKT